MTKKQVDEILKNIGYFENFKKLLNASYSGIDYGRRLGVISFDSLLDADKKYAYNGDVETKEFHDWTKILNDNDSSEEDLLVVCLKVFDWGNVLKGNVKSVVSLYEAKALKNYLSLVKELLNYNKLIEQKDLKGNEIIWSSGWTKVYSFLNTDILIYDSRVSAFLNYTLIQGHNEFTEIQKSNFQQISNVLYNFKGAPGREREVKREYGFKNQHPNGIRGFNANLVSSWILQLTKEKLEIEENMRALERAFFMLGFDLKQLNV